MNRTSIYNKHHLFCTKAHKHINAPPPHHLFKDNRKLEAKSTLQKTKTKTKTKKHMWNQSSPFFRIIKQPLNLNFSSKFFSTLHEKEGTKTYQTSLNLRS
ncbi:hypothetical protein Hanom_Chr03g00215271 [Helianthus anomalus]